MHGSLHENGSTARERIEESPARHGDSSDAQKEEGDVRSEAGRVPMQAMGVVIASARPIEAMLPKIEVYRGAVFIEASTEPLVREGRAIGYLLGIEYHSGLGLAPKFVIAHRSWLP